MLFSNDTPIALQLWTIRDALALDARDALRRVKSKGFSAVEIAPPPEGLSHESLAGCLAESGLTVVSIHAELPTRHNIGDLLGLSRAYQCSRLIWSGWPRDPRFDSLGGLRELIAAYQEAQKIAQAEGLRFGLHNHWWEFERVEGVTPVRLFQEVLPPDIFWQIDVYWAQTAGADPAEVVRALGERVGSIHWKNGPAVHGEPMTALSKGKVDIPKVLGALSRPGDWVIELDECATDPLEAAEQGRLYLESRRVG
jgi:sugar phosphate isomerase/epimerase